MRGPQQARAQAAAGNDVVAQVGAGALEAFDDGKRHPVHEGYAEQAGDDKAEQAAGDLVAHLDAVRASLAQ
jgi:hypothetical protein